MKYLNLCVCYEREWQIKEGWGVGRKARRAEEQWLITDSDAESREGVTSCPKPKRFNNSSQGWQWVDVFNSFYFFGQLFWPFFFIEDTIRRSFSSCSGPPSPRRFKFLLFFFYFLNLTINHFLFNSPIEGISCEGCIVGMVHWGIGPSRSPWRQAVLHVQSDRLKY
jgi:hypothetical protein